MTSIYPGGGPDRRPASSRRLNSINFNLARSVGPAIGGALMAVFEATANFTVNTCSYIALIDVWLR